MSIESQFTFWPLVPIGALVLVLLLLTLLSRNGIPVNTFIAMFAVSGLFGLTMVSFSLELTRKLTWKILWRPYLVAFGVVVVSILSAWLLERNKKDKLSE